MATVIKKITLNKPVVIVSLEAEVISFTITELYGPLACAAKIAIESSSTSNYDGYPYEFINIF